MGRGFIHYFTTFLMLPHHHARTQPGWQGEPPALTAAVVRDWAALSERLREAENRPAGDPIRVLVERLPEEFRQPDFSDSASRDRWLAAVNAVLSEPSFHAAIRLERLTAPVPHWVRGLWTRRDRHLRPDQHAALNRGVLDAALGEKIVRPRQPGVLEKVPPAMLADPSAHPDALDGFVTGLGGAGDRFTLARIPWAAWRAPIVFWVFLLGAMGLCVVGLSLVLHRQWADHEHLPYPTTAFVRALLGDEDGGSLVFRRGAFWAGLLPVFALHLINYANVWWPDYVIPVQRTLNFEPLLELLPVFRRANPSFLFNPTLYFTAMGFAYFLSSDVAFSLGIAPYLFTLVWGTVAGFGIATAGPHLQPHLHASMYAGASVAMFLTLLHSGRRHLKAVLIRALGGRVRDPVEPAAVWGARILLAGFILFVGQLMRAGVEAPLAVFYTLGALMIFTVMSRLLAEAGVFFFHPHFYPCGLLLGFLGTAAIGPEQLLLLGMVSSLLLIDPREALMPYAVSALRIAEDARLPIGRTAVVGGAAVLLAAAIAIPVSLYWQYREGAIKTGDGWTVNNVPRMVFDLNVSTVRTLEAQGLLGPAQAVSGWSRFRAATPMRGPTLVFGLSFLLALLLVVLRRRLARWPLHPLIFLMGTHWQSRTLAFSFLVGWAVKALVMKYGGERAYRALRPAAIGLIAGEVLAALIPLVAGLLYQVATGQPPRPYRIMPS